VPDLGRKYENFSYIQISDCLKHDVTFPPKTAIFVDNYCGKMEIRGTTVSHINVIENHGTIRSKTSGTIEWLTVYQNYHLIHDRAKVKNLALFNAWPGSEILMNKVVGNVYSGDLKSGATLEMTYCLSETFKLWTGNICGTFKMDPYCYSKLALLDARYENSGCEGNPGG